MNPDALRTVKVDPETMETLARHSMGLSGPPVSVTLDNDEGNPIRAVAVICCLVVVAFGVGVLLGRPERQAPPLPPPVRTHVEAMTLKPVELQAPHEPCRDGFKD